MQCRQARLHSLVTCHATYSGAARSAEPAAGAAACSAESLPGAIFWSGVTASILDEPLDAKLGDEGVHLLLDRLLRIEVALLQAREDLARIAPGLELADDRGADWVQGEHLFGPGLEQDAAELLFAELYVFRKAHDFS